MDSNRNSPLHTLTGTVSVYRHVFVVNFVHITNRHLPSPQLHTSRTPDSQMLEVVEEITNLFVKSGIHLDAVNVHGLTASQLATSRKSLRNFVIAILMYNNNRIVRLHTATIIAVIRRCESNETCLRCLASRCIAQHQIPYEGVVPKHLEDFIQMHCAEKL